MIFIIFLILISIRIDLDYCKKHFTAQTYPRRVCDVDHKFVAYALINHITLTLTIERSCELYFHSQVIPQNENNYENIPLSILLPNNNYLSDLFNIKLVEFDNNNNVIQCFLYSHHQNRRERQTECVHKYLQEHFSRQNIIEIPLITHQSGVSLEVCLVPDIPSDLNATNTTSNPEPTPAPTSKTTISASTHPFMSTQAILIPLIFFAIIAFGGLSYHFELYRHLPFCAKPSGFLPFEDEFSATISEEEEGVVNFDCPQTPPSPNSYSLVDRSGMNSPITSKMQILRHVDTFTNRIDGMLSAAREGVSNFPSTSGISNLANRGHHRLPNSDDGLENGHENSQNSTSQRSQRSDNQIDDPNEEEVTVELMTL